MLSSAELAAAVDGYARATLAWLDAHDGPCLEISVWGLAVELPFAVSPMDMLDQVLPALAGDERLVFSITPTGIRQFEAAAESLDSYVERKLPMFTNRMLAYTRKGHSYVDTDVRGLVGSPSLIDADAAANRIVSLLQQHPEVVYKVDHKGRIVFSGRTVGPNPPATPVAVSPVPTTPAATTTSLKIHETATPATSAAVSTVAQEKISFFTQRMLSYVSKGHKYYASDVRGLCKVPATINQDAVIDAIVSALKADARVMHAVDDRGRLYFADASVPPAAPLPPPLPPTPLTPAVPMPPPCLHVQAPYVPPMPPSISPSLAMPNTVTTDAAIDINTELATRYLQQHKASILSTIATHEVFHVSVVLFQLLPLLTPDQSPEAVVAAVVALLKTDPQLSYHQDDVGRQYFTARAASIDLGAPATEPWDAPPSPSVRSQFSESESDGSNFDNDDSDDDSDDEGGGDSDSDDSDSSDCSGNSRSSSGDKASTGNTGSKESATAVDGAELAKHVAILRIRMLKTLVKLPRFYVALIPGVGALATSPLARAIVEKLRQNPRVIYVDDHPKLRPHFMKSAQFQVPEANDRTSRSQVLVTKLTPATVQPPTEVLVVATAASLRDLIQCHDMLSKPHIPGAVAVDAHGTLPQLLVALAWDDHTVLIDCENIDVGLLVELLAPLLQSTFVTKVVYDAYRIADTLATLSDAPAAGFLDLQLLMEHSFASFDISFATMLSCSNLPMHPHPRFLARPALLTQRPLDANAHDAAAATAQLLYQASQAHAKAIHDHLDLVTHATSLRLTTAVSATDGTRKLCLDSRNNHRLVSHEYLSTWRPEDVDANTPV
ncbi:hypothetical protein ACHHYP_06837, partial [Achlya hypogyna]